MYAKALEKLTIHMHPLIIKCDGAKGEDENLCL